MDGEVDQSLAAELTGKDTASVFCCVLSPAVLSGAAAAALSWLADGDLSPSVLAGPTTAALGVSFFNRLIADAGGAQGDQRG